MSDTDPLSPEAAAAAREAALNAEAQRLADWQRSLLEAEERLTRAEADFSRGPRTDRDALSAEAERLAADREALATERNAFEDMRAGRRPVPPGGRPAAAEAGTYEEYHDAIDRGEKATLKTEALPAYERIISGSKLFGADGKMDGELMQEINSMKRRLELAASNKELVENLKESVGSVSGVKPSSFDKMLKMGAVKQFEVTQLERKLNRELKLQHDALRKVLSDYGKVFNQQVSPELRGRSNELMEAINLADSEPARKEAQKAFDKFVRSTEGANQGLLLQMEATIDKHNTAIEEIKDLAKSFEEHGLKFNLKDPGAKVEVAPKAEVKPTEVKTEVAPHEAPKGPNKMVAALEAGFGLGLLYDGATNEDRQGAMKVGEIGLGALMTGHGAYKLLSKVSGAAEHALKA